MIKKTIFLAYGIKLIATWMLIPFVLMFVPILVNEFSATFSTQDVVLQEETYSGYPDEYLCFKTNINGKERAVHAPVTAKTGDTITIILRNGEYYMTPKDSKDLYETTTFTGRFLKRCNNNFGYHVIAITVVLLITFLLTLGKKKLIHKEAQKLSKVTDITGIICSISMSAALIYGVVDNTLMGLGVAYMFLVLGMIYTAVFVVAWIIAMRYYSFEELKNE
jgi:hypothetical protein